MLNNKDFDFEKSNVNKHDKINMAVIASYKFEKEHGIDSTRLVKSYASCSVWEELKTNIKINNAELDKFNIYNTLGGIAGTYNGVYIPNEIKTALTPDEIQKINNSLLDNNENYSVGAMTMLAIAQQKGTTDDLIKLNKEWQSQNKESVKKMFIIQTGNDIEESNTETLKQVFSGWTKDDYLKSIKIAKQIKSRMIEKYIDFFTNPKEYIYDGNRTVLEKITGIPLKSQSQPTAEKTV
jgi:hypothetical protein